MIIALCSALSSGRLALRPVVRFAGRGAVAFAAAAALERPVTAQSTGSRRANTSRPAAVAVGTKKVVPVVLFATWHDPREGGFTISVPEGWQVSGGTTRHSALDVQQSVRVAMPSGRLQLFVGDADLLPRQEPDQMTQVGGFREGQAIRAAWGGTILLERFRTGRQFAEQYAAWKLCRRPEVTSAADLPDQASAMNAQLAPAARAAQVAVGASVGEAYYRCGQQVGYVTATTVGVGPLAGLGAHTWFVLQVSGFVLTNPADGAYAQYVLHTMTSSFKVDPQWQARADQQTQAVTAAVTHMQQTMMASLQQRNAALASAERARAVASNNKIDVMKPWQVRMASLDSNRIKDSDTRLGITVTADPLWGDRTVSNDSYYYWTRPDGSIAGTNTDQPPDNSGGWRQMTTHP